MKWIHLHSLSSSTGKQCGCCYSLVLILLGMCNILPVSGNFSYAYVIYARVCMKTVLWAPHPLMRDFPGTLLGTSWEFSVLFHPASLLIHCCCSHDSSCRRPDFQAQRTGGNLELVKEVSSGSEGGNSAHPAIG